MPYPSTEVDATPVILALETVGARITGSWARGEEHPTSDFDFYVSTRAWDRFVRLAPKGWESSIVGHVAWRTDEGLIEASRLFARQRKRLPSRELFGRTWKTW